MPLPIPEEEDDSIIEEVCLDAFFEPGKKEWVASYVAYREAGGNPWAIEPLHVENDVRAKRYALYDTRRNSPALRSIRDDPQLNSCPMCGSPVIGSLDHYLPRATYSEYSIMRANLVPACTHCNSGTKGKTHKGKGSPERFIHPYFDTWAADPIWQVAIDPPYPAATFRPIPAPGMSEPRTAIVEFHLEHVLGKQFSISIGNLWATYHREIAVNPGDGSLASLVACIGRDEKIAEITSGINSWRAAFLRGLQANGQAIEYLRARLLDHLAVAKS